MHRAADHLFESARKALSGEVVDALIDEGARMNPDDVYELAQSTVENEWPTLDLVAG